MSEIDDIFSEITASLREEGLGAQREDAAFIRDGERIDLNLHPDVVGLLERLVKEVSELLTERDQQCETLFPDAYQDDETSNAAWKLVQCEFMRDERLERCRVVLEGIQRGWLSLEEADDWMRVMNDMRLLVTGRSPSDRHMKKLYRADTPHGAIFMLASAVLQALLEVA